MALDIATRTGFAIGGPGVRPVFGAKRLKEKHETYDHVANNMGKWMVEVCYMESECPEMIVFEAPIPPYQNQGKGDREDPIKRNIDSILLPQRAIGALQGIAPRYGVQVRGVNMQSVRKHFLGAGNSRGNDVKDRVVQRCIELDYVPVGYRDHDVCDALALYDYACAVFDKRSGSESFALRGGR